MVTLHLETSLQPEWKVHNARQPCTQETSGQCERVGLWYYMLIQILCLQLIILLCSPNSALPVNELFESIC